jgi:uncharacterized membrane protein
MMAKKKSKKAGSNAAEEGKVCSILAYLLVGIIWYFADDDMKKNKFVKYHVKQGLVLLIAWLAYSIALGVVFAVIFTPIFFMGGGFGLLAILRLLYYVPFIFLIIGIINALNGKEKELPIIGKYGRKFKF